MPIGVKVISVFMFFGAAMLFLLSILMFALTSLLQPLMVNLPLPAGLGSAILIVVGVFFLTMAVVDIVLGVGLWKGRRWARILTLVFSGIGVVGIIFAIIVSRAAVESIVGNFFSLIVNGLIFYYLGFSKEAKAAFR